MQSLAIALERERRPKHQMDPQKNSSYKQKKILEASRNRALSQWRGQDIRPAEEERRSSDKSAKVVFTQLLKSIRIDQRRSEGEIISAWNKLVSPSITEHAQPVELRRKTLVVEVDSPVWMDEIKRWHSREILQQLQTSFGKERIANLMFRISG